MEKEALKRIFEFLEEKGEHKAPFIWKHMNDIPLTKEELNIKGNLDLTDSKIKSLPEGLKVGGDLYLDGSYVKSLPKGLKVGGDLYLDGSYGKSLPKGLKVGGDLYLDGSSVHSLPKGLEVYGDLYIADTILASKSDDDLIVMIKPGFIKGEIINNEEEYDEGYDD
jgi:hypothetical protein